MDPLLDNNNPLSVAAIIKKADDRLYRTLMFAPLLARLLYAMCFAVVAITGFVLQTRWDIKDLYKTRAEKSDVSSNVDEMRRNAKLVDQIYKDFYHRDPPPR
jgi:hypothetical protein